MKKSIRWPDSQCDADISISANTNTDPLVEIVGWACKDKDGSLTIFYNCNTPEVADGDDYWSVFFGNDLGYLPKDLIPDLTFENSPRKVKITITPIKK